MEQQERTFEECIEWLHSYAEGAKSMAEMVISWRLDALRVYVGLAEVVPWPDSKDVLSRWYVPPERDEDTRVIHYNGYAYLIRDKK